MQKNIVFEHSYLMTSPMTSPMTSQTYEVSLVSYIFIKMVTKFISDIRNRLDLRNIVLFRTY